MNQGNLIVEGYTKELRVKIQKIIDIRSFQLSNSLLITNGGLILTKKQSITLRKMLQMLHKSVLRSE